MIWSDVSGTDLSSSAISAISSDNYGYYQSEWWRMISLISINRPVYASNRYSVQTIIYHSYPYSRVDAIEISSSSPVCHYLVGVVVDRVGLGILLYLANQLVVLHVDPDCSHRLAHHVVDPLAPVAREETSELVQYMIHRHLYSRKQYILVAKVSPNEITNDVQVHGLAVLELNLNRRDDTGRFECKC